MRNAIQQQIQFEQEEEGLVKGRRQSSSAKSRIMIRMIKYSLKHRSLVFWANLGLFFSSLGLVLLPYLAGQIVDQISKDHQDNQDNQEELNYLSIQFSIVFIICAFFSFIRSYSFDMLGERVVQELRNELFQKLLQKDIEFFDNNRSGELISRITSDVTLVQSACSDTISVLLRNILQFFGSIIFLFSLSWKLTLVFLTVIPVFCGAALIFIRIYKTLTKQYQDQLAMSTQVATESLTHIRVVRSFSTEEQEVQQFCSSTEKAFIIGKKKSFVIGAFSGVGMLIGNIGIMCILWYGGTLVLNGEMSVGNLSSFVLYTMTLAVSVLAASGMLNLLLTAAAVCEKIFQLMDHEVKIVNGTITPSGEAFQGNILLENIQFTYPTKPSVPILKNLTLQINAGDVIAFVGPSGSGKSTIVSLIERFYDVSEGKIKIDNVDLKNYDLKFLHQNIGFVSQEPTLFSGTIKENIVYGYRNATEQEIIQAIKQAHAYDFIMNKEFFPDGLNTIVGERGVKLSGGQKQRIAIARALIKNPRILIFDEATSALDAESEFQVQMAIEDLMKSGQKTIIIIAHRLSTIINCNLIAVLHDGLIVELGPHNELVRLNGIYRQLVDRQLQSK